MLKPGDIYYTVDIGAEDRAEELAQLSFDRRAKLDGVTFGPKVRAKEMERKLEKFHNVARHKVSAYQAVVQ